MSEISLIPILKKAAYSLVCTVNGGFDC
uniref:Uncharacterized protein n=1 Tax=Arundo donax TaxID=35708 RepID=A0A0A8YBN7_ARUDO